MKPKRIQRKRTRGWRMPQGVIYVGRPTKWGNPWRIDSCTVAHARRICADNYERWLRKSLGYELIDVAERDLILGSLADLRGKDLACWCPLDQPCHADVLLELASDPPRSDP